MFIVISEVDLAIHCPKIKSDVSIITPGKIGNYVFAYLEIKADFGEIFVENNFLVKVVLLVN